MAKPKKLRLRGAEFESVSLSITKEGGCFASADMRCDITADLAEEMGWEIYTKDEDGKPAHLIAGLRNSTALEGEIEVEEIYMKLNGSGKNPLECVARRLDGFSLTRAKDAAGGMKTTLHFKLVSSAWEMISHHFGMYGKADGVLVLTRPPEQTVIPEAQMNLQDAADATEDAEGQEPASDATEEAGESRPGVLASVTQMRKRNMRTPPAS